MIAMVMPATSQPACLFGWPHHPLGVCQVRDAPILLQKSADFCDKIRTKLSIAMASAN